MTRSLPVLGHVRGLRVRRLYSSQKAEMRFLDGSGAVLSTLTVPPGGPCVRDVLVEDGAARVEVEGPLFFEWIFAESEVPRA